MVAQLAGIGEVRHFPTIEVILRHALLGKALELVGVAGGLGAEQAVAPNLFRRAPVVDLVELVAAPELRR
jgi:hypothetical protein